MDALRFLSTPSARRATRRRAPEHQGRHHFYPRPPRGGRRLTMAIKSKARHISIHALREEGDPTPKCGTNGSETFLSTPSARRATYFFFIPSRLLWISIHALREEGDFDCTCASALLVYFYPRPPRGGRRLPFRAYAKVWNISIHALREEGDCSKRRTCRNLWISIHALREEGDGPRQFCNGGHSIFLSTPSARRATAGEALRVGGVVISIHALREEGDVFKRSKALQKSQFLSTPSARRATYAYCTYNSTTGIFLSTPSARRATLRPHPRRAGVLYFYPRPPRGGRPVWVSTITMVPEFLSTPSARRATAAKI